MSFRLAGWSDGAALTCTALTPVVWTLDWNARSVQGACALPVSVALPP